MTGDVAAAAVIDALESAGIPYMVVGSFSSNLYGVPRSTQDADIVVQADSAGIARLRDRLGQVLRWEPQTSFETVTATMRQVLEVPESGFKVELFLLSNDPHDQERFARRTRVPMLGREVCAASAEDVVITKLRWSRQGRRGKDVEDVRAVVAVSGHRLDWNYIYNWCDQHSTRALLDEIRRSLPPL